MPNACCPMPKKSKDIYSGYKETNSQLEARS
jgi:hypothetical protein